MTEHPHRLEFDGQTYICPRCGFETATEERAQKHYDEYLQRGDCPCAHCHRLITEGEALERDGKYYCSTTCRDFFDAGPVKFLARELLALVMTVAFVAFALWFFLGPSCGLR